MTYTFNNNSTPDPYNDLYWEPCKVPSTACQFIASDKSRYIYTSGDSSGSNWNTMFGVYDSYTNGWKNINTFSIYNINSPYNISPIITYNKSSRFQGFIYAADSTSLSAGFLMNKTQLIGKKIRIENGSGAGQERTIIAVDDPVIVFNFTTSQMTYGNYIRMSGLSMKNEYCGLSYKPFSGNATNNGYIPALQNIIQMCELTDANNYTTAYGGNIALYSPTSFLLRYTKVYLDSPWNTIPDITYKFSMEDESIIFNGTINSAFNGYNCLINEYFKNNNVGAFTNNLSSEYMTRRYYNNQTNSMKTQAVSIHNSYGREEYGTATSGTFRILTDTTKTWTTNQWKNYKLKITGGSGFFQEDTIQSNDSTSITLLRSFETTMNTGSTYEIYPDDDKVYFRISASNISSSSTTSPTLIQKSRRFNTEFSSKILESGITTMIGYFECCYGQFNIRYLSRVNNVATLGVESGPLPFPKVGSKITVSYVTGPDVNLYNGSFTIDSRPDVDRLTYIMSGTPSGNPPLSPYQSSDTTVVDPSKNWITNEFVGKIIIRKCDQGGENWYQYRTITANDSTSITFYPQIDNSNWTGNTRYTHYTIFDTKSFGAIETNDNTTNGYGTATGSIPKLDLAYNPDGTYIGLIDTTKNWGINDFVGMYVKFPLLKGEIESLIVSNDATSVTWTDPISVAPDQYFPYSIVDLPDSGAFGSTTQQCSLVWVSNSSDTYNKSRYLYTTAGNGNYGMYRYDISLETWVFCDLPTPVGTCIKYDEQDSLYFGDGSTDTIYKYNVVTGVTSIVGQFFGSNGNFDLDILVDQYNNTWLYCTNKNWNQMFRALLPPQS